MEVESLLYEKQSDQSVICHICQRRCNIIEGNWGYCRTRINRNGKLYSTIYGEVSTVHKAPIEIKPVYHFLPGSFALSLGSLGCNFLCPGCQNWNISFARIKQLNTQTRYISPEESIHLAIQHNCQGISWTYNEPTLWLEYTLEGAKLAREKDLYTNYVTNGYISPEALDIIGPYIDIFRVDIKGFSEQTYRKIANISNWKGILEIILLAKRKWNMHVELVTNIIINVNDDMDELKALACWIRNELGSHTPWHITRFFPQWGMSDMESTPISTLESICDMALNVGLNYVYIGNVPDHPRNHTYCSGCGNKLVNRTSMDRIVCKIYKDKCPVCGETIVGKFTV